MRIVILDGYTENPGDLSWDSLKEFGDLTVYDRTPYEDDVIAQRIGDAEVVFTNKCPVRKAVMDACPKLKYISVLATGYNIVDVAYAGEKGIQVSNVPTYGTASVGQFAIALLLEICHHVAHHSAAVHEGRWGQNPDWCFWDYPLIELAGKTMGIIGFGKIGQTTGKIAKALGMKILATGSRETETGRAIADYVDMDTLLRESDVIALHCPLFPSTEGIINRETIAKMKDGVILINNSRGQLVVEKDLADALNSGKIAAAGLDVVSTEPIRDDNPLLKAKNCLITPHISWAPKESRQRIMQTSAENLRAYLSGSPINLVSC
ncbi:MAG: D-2-hydroxyacid dehydrogenase [Oscillospiraceae bacterium]|nr:D-2-hydroxyacid dehydrogenase [Oscillospiraceae bacterium]